MINILSIAHKIFHMCNFVDARDRWNFYFNNKDIPIYSIIPYHIIEVSCIAKHHVPCTGEAV